LFLNDVGWLDVTKLMKDRRTIGLSDQLYRALGSISANIEEGYSRGSNKDRTRFYEYSLGSSRESRGWYYRGRHVLGEMVVQHRLKLLTEIIRLLLTMIPEERGYTVHDKNAPYPPSKKPDLQETLTSEELEDLLTSVPLPPS
jgi:four helix bundle protein